MDETLTQNEPTHEWRSNGGCERCDALDGHQCHEGSMVRPHPRCDCAIIDRSRPSRRCDGSWMLLELQFAQNVHHGGVSGADDEEFDLLFDFRIHCPDGTQVIEGELSVSRTYGEWMSSEDLLDEAYEEAYDRLHEIAESECPACGEAPLVS